MELWVKHEDMLADCPPFRLGVNGNAGFSLNPSTSKVNAEMQENVQEGSLP